MENITSSLDPQIKLKVETWLTGNYDEVTKNEIKDLIKNNPKELLDAFYRDLEFGTGGLRGIMGVGTNRMNVYTVSMATQGYATYLKQNFKDKEQIKVAIAHDSRNNSKLFALKTAEIFSANGIKAYLFEDLRPTPELSFAIRHLGAQGGVVVTASHNPKEYNGYKVYWEDGGQVIAPHDENIIKEVQNVGSFENVLSTPNKALIELIGEDIDKIYIDKVKALSLFPEIIAKHKDLKIVYTPIHGTGVNLVPRALKAYGFENVTIIAEQSIPDGNFPTVKSPNPEESAALELAVKKAREINADIVLATDPDADRVGIAVRNLQGEIVLLNGNQTATLLVNYLINAWKKKGKLTGKEYIVKTIVTTELLKDIAEKNGVESFDVLTGFKFIAEKILENEGKKTFIGGGEESYGYLAGEFVRDKDAIMACALISEALAYATENGSSFFEQLVDIYIEYGFYKEALLSITKKGKDGAEEIQKMMAGYRANPPKEINNSKVAKLIDYLQTDKTGLPKSDVLQFFLEDGTKITVRPSGTEPKIKFYFGVKGELKKKEDFDAVSKLLDGKVEAVINSLKLRD